ncbi:hypothetical protein ACRRTK_008966 [Alexandromys fortis]
MATVPAMSSYGHSNGWSPGTSESMWILSCPGHFPWALLSQEMAPGHLHSTWAPSAASVFSSQDYTSESPPPPPQPATSGLSEIQASEVAVWGQGLF